MHRKIAVTTLLYNHLYPRPNASDPPNFSNHLARNLIPEIRVETQRYYGNLDTIEARYPGLNYTHAPHIRRLSAFPHHARLFQAIRHLRITESEVLDLARWEGTLWARQRFEKDEGYQVKDTTGDDVPAWSDPRKTTKLSAIRATKTTIFTTVTGVRELPTPLTATSCELEVQEPEQADTPPPAEPELVATPAQIEEEADATLGAEDGSDQGPSGRTTPRGHTTSQTPQQFLDAFAPGASTEFYAQMHDLLARVSAMPTSGIDMFREEISRRLASMDPAELPTAINFVSNMQLYMDQHLRPYANADNTTSQPEARQQIISQPAA